MRLDLLPAKSPTRAAYAWRFNGLSAVHGSAPTRFNMSMHMAPLLG